MGYNRSYIEVERSFEIDLLDYEDEILELLKHKFETGDNEWLELLTQTSNRRVLFDLDFSIRQFPMDYLIKTLGTDTLEKIKEVCNES